MPTITRGTIKSYDPAAHTAGVQIAGSLAVWLDAVPVSDAISPADVVAGRECGVIFFSDDDPNDAAVVTVHNALPIGSHRTRDADGDTYVDVERTPDEDKIAMYTAGTLRWLLQNASPHAQLTGDMQASGAIAALGSAITAGYGFVVESSGDCEGKTGLVVNLGATLGFAATAVTGVGGHAFSKNTVTTTLCAGLDFAVGISGISGTAPQEDAVRLSFQHSGTATIPSMRGVVIGAAYSTGAIAQITEYVGVDMIGSGNSKFRAVIGLRFGSFSNANATPVPIDADSPARTDNNAGSVHRGNFQFGSRTRAFGTGDGVLGLAYATTNPSTNPAGGVVIYASAASGDFKVRGAVGQVCALPTGGAPTVTGSRGGNAALASLLTTLAGLGLIVDSTT
jgi:hypothetical protein